MLCIGLFICVTLLFPLTAGDLAHFLGVASIDIVIPTAVFELFVKPVAYPILAVCLAAIAMPRARSVGMPAAIGICIALLAFAEIPADVLATIFRKPIAAEMVMRFPLVPSFMIAGITALVTLGLARELPRPMKEWGGAAYRLWAVLLVFITVIAIVRLLGPLSLLVLGSNGLSLLHVFQTIFALIANYTLHPLALLLFIAASANLVICSRRQAGKLLAPPTGGTQSNFERRS